MRFAEWVKPGPGLALVDGEAKVAKPFLEGLQQSSRIVLVLEPKHHVVGIAADNDLSPRIQWAPALTVVRLSIGLETIDDIIADLSQALDYAAAEPSSTQRAAE